MNKRPLGQSGLEIAPLVFGGNVFGWTIDEKTSFELLDTFVDAGLNAIDTADMYSVWADGNQGGESETIIGNWLKANPGKRDKVLILTKVGMELGDERKGLSRRWIERAVEDSLRRIQVETIDLYQSHLFDPEVPLEETLGAYQRLIEQGKVRAIGASNHDAGQLRQALDVSAANGLPRYATLQPEYNLYDRSGYEGALRDLAIEENLGVITYYSLASGFLSGKYRSAADLGKSPRGEDIGKYLDARGQRILAALDGGRRQASGDAGGGRPGLAHRHARSHRADRQRDQAQPAGQPGQGGQPDAGRGGHGDTQRHRRLIAEGRARLGEAPGAASQARPPLARSTCPLIQPDCGPARKATTAAMSCGSPRRSSGGILANCRTCSSLLPSRNSSVATGPGATALTRMLRPRSSLANTAVKASTAALLAL